ncbi:MAG: preprotein translocase subunit YajC [Planctomycetota bacterium]
MRTLILALPQGDAPPQGPSEPGGSPNMFLFLLLPLLILFVLMPLFNKKDRLRRQRIAGIKKHDRVVTSGGIYGTVTAMDDASLTLEVAKDVRIRVKRTSVFDIETPADAAKKAGTK